MARRVQVNSARWLGSFEYSEPCKLAQLHDFRLVSLENCPEKGYPEKVTRANQRHQRLGFRSQVFYRDQEED